MLRSARRLHGFTLHATDGDLGEVDDLYFDDERWTVRYFVVATGGWLAGRRVLVSPFSARRPDWEHHRLPVDLTCEQVRDAPDVDTHRPVSRRNEVRLAQYYGFPYYWPGPFMWGPVVFPGEDRPPADAAARAQAEAEAGEDTHLRSVRAVTGYTIHALDGDLGHVDDFVVEDGTWTIRYLVVDTRRWWPGKQVVVSPEWVIAVSWFARTVSVGMRRETIRGAPPYDPSRPIDREWEERVHAAYGRPRYWHRRPAA